MSNVIRSLIVKVGADTSDFSNKMKNISKDLKATGKSLSSAGASLTKGLTLPILGVGAALGACVADAANAETYIAQLDAVLKSTGGAAGVTRDQALGLAEALEKTTKFTAESTLEAENLLLTFTNIGKDVFPETTKIALDMATALGTDAAAGAVSLGKALNDPIKGVSALSRVGVTFTDQQKDQIKVLQESGDMMGAQKIILAELSKEFGGSAEAAGKTFAGQLEILKNQFGAVKEEIGVAVMPLLQALVPVIQQNIIPALQSFSGKIIEVINWFKNLDPGMQKFILGLVGAAAAAGPVLSAVGGLTTKIGGAVGTISKFSKALSGGSTILGALGTALGPTGIIMLGLAAFAVIAFTIYKNWDKITAAVSGAISKAKEFLGLDGKKSNVNVGSSVSYKQNGMTQYAKGTNYVPQDGQAYLHKGEAVIPAKYNKGGSTVNHTGTITVRGVNNQGELVAVMEQNMASKISNDNRRIPNRASLIPIG